MLQTLDWVSVKYKATVLCYMCAFWLILAPHKPLKDGQTLERSCSWNDWKSIFADKIDSLISRFPLIILTIQPI